MLIQFSATNYRSLKDKATLSLLAGTDKEHAGDLIDIGGKKRLVPAAAIYGANSSGKSNILMAMQTMQSMTTGENAKLLKDKPLPYDPFAFDVNTQTAPTEYEVIFYYKDTKYAYSFSHDKKQILTEELYHWPKGREALIFSREGDHYTFRENEKEQSILAGRTPNNRLYLVASNEWNAPQTELAYEWFSKKLTYHDHVTPHQTLEVLLNWDFLSEKTFDEIKKADLGISGYYADERQGTSVTFTHKTLTNEKQEEFDLPLEAESKGTQRFFSRIGPWIIALNQGEILFVDELEASMHPMLTRRLVEMMQNPEINKNHAQLIFTTHDVMLLDLSLLRRDQIWFTDKDPKTLATELFSLWEFSARKGENIRKGYLQGRFGAIPFLGGDAKWREE